MDRRTFIKATAGLLVAGATARTAAAPGRLTFMGRPVVADPCAPRGVMYFYDECAAITPEQWRLLLRRQREYNAAVNAFNDHA